MSQLVAFLRAINVGGHTVKMEQLRTLFEELRFANVETFIASGNVLFDTRGKDTAALERKIETHLRKALGYEVRTFLRSPEELGRIVAYEPFTKAEIAAPENTLYVAFLASEPGDDVRRKVAAFRADGYSLHLHAREVYVLRRGKESEVIFSGALLEKLLGMPSTMRNITTVRKLAAKCAAT
jgi:uncharacterized protein (DUF1697 family)